MMTADQIAGMSAEEHSAWIESLDEDEAIVLHTPVGFRYMLVAIADVKVVLSKKIPAEYRLKFLEFLKGHEDMFTAEAIAAVEPFNDEA